MKNSQQGFIVPVLLVIIALLVVGGGVYVYKNKKVEVPTVVDTGTQQSNQVQQTNTKTQTIQTDQKTYPSFEKAILSLNTGDDQTSMSGLKPLVGTLADLDLNRAKDAVIDFVSNYKQHIQTRPKTLLTALYFLKYNKESSAKIIEANNFLCSSDELKTNPEVQGILRQACN